MGMDDYSSANGGSLKEYREDYLQSKANDPEYNWEGLFRLSEWMAKGE